jgi:hypothetical protein
MAADLLELIFALDIREDLAHLRTPTVVIHRTADRTVPFSQGPRGCHPRTRCAPDPPPRRRAPSLARGCERHRRRYRQRARPPPRTRRARRAVGAVPDRTRARSAHARRTRLQRLRHR